LLYFARDKRAVSSIVPLTLLKLKRDGSRQAVHISQSLDAPAIVFPSRVIRLLRCWILLGHLSWAVVHSSAGERRGCWRALQAWREPRDWTARKYALWDAGKRLPPNEWEPRKPCSTFMKFPCGDIFNSHCLEENLVHVPHISAVAARRPHIQGPR
jgi:hypothetical protein